MSCVSITDYVVERQRQHDLRLQLPRLQAALVRALERERDATERELAIRERLIARHNRGKMPRGDGPGGVVWRRSSSRTIDFRPDAPPSYQVTLSRGAVKAIEEELGLMSPHRVETGGFLWAVQRPMSSSWASVEMATGPANNSRHGSHSVILGRAEDIKAQLPSFLSHMRYVGNWHSHPHPDSSQPSTADREAWAARLKQIGWSRYISLIATPSPGIGWMYPELHAWVTRTNGRGGYVIEPARIDK